jgi:hypothetical protein
MSNITTPTQRPPVSRRMAMCSAFACAIDKHLERWGWGGLLYYWHLPAADWPWWHVDAFRDESAWIVQAGRFELIIDRANPSSVT